MSVNTITCPNCGAPYNPAKIRCEYCGSFVIMTNEKQFTVPQQIVESIEVSADNCPGVYVFGTLLGKGETPLRLGAANYYKNSFLNVGGRVLLTKKSIQFSTHTFLQSKDTIVIPLADVIRVEYDKSNLGISDQISVYTNEKRHKFVVWGGKEWVALIENAKNNMAYPQSQVAAPPGTSYAVPIDAPPVADHSPAVASADYTEELRRLKGLLDAGIITEDEFAIKKRQILNI